MNFSLVLFFNCHIIDACWQVVVVSLAIDIGLVELHTVRPLLLDIVYPACEIVGPIGGGCSTDDEPDVAAIGRAIESNGVVGVVVGGACEVAVDA